jgi:choline dehydrogenase-like flavoprotein
VLRTSRSNPSSRGAEIVLESDVVVVGSGPGGATVARGLARGGKRVLLLERGIDHRAKPWYGTYLGGAMYAERAGFLLAREGLMVVRPLMVGGATSMYCGSAAPPPPWLAERYGVDLEPHASAAAAELGAAPLPEPLRGPASTRLAEAGRELGYGFEPQAKLVAPARASVFDCSAACMLGCRCGAKWSAAEYVDDAVSAGAELRTRARAARILVEDGRAAGVCGLLGGKPFRALAGTVVLAAGGLGTPAVLRASGLRDAGNGLAMDTTVIVYGIGRGAGNGVEPPMTWSWEIPDERLMLSTLVDPRLLHPVVAARSGWGHVGSWARWRSLRGVMVKLRDDVAGGLLAGGAVSKPLTSDDADRLRWGEEVARRILRQAAVDPATIFTSPARGTHPSASVRIGRMVDRELRTEIDGLYVCDASVFPEALGRPTVLTIVAFARRLVASLLA